MSEFNKERLWHCVGAFGAVVLIVLVAVACVTDCMAPQVCPECGANYHGDIEVRATFRSESEAPDAT